MDVLRGYSDRDREMFALGYEYAESLRHLCDLASRKIHNLAMTVHVANAARIFEVAKTLSIEVKVEDVAPASGMCAISAIRSTP